MIELSNSALKYAIDICNECDKYKVGIAVLDIAETKTTIDTLKELLEGCPNWSSTIARISDYYYNIQFKNGSIIRIIRPSEHARGHRFNVIISDVKLYQEYIDTLRCLERPIWNR